MEFIGVTRVKDGEETEEFVIKCSEHPFYYKGMPPVTHGCRDCWLTYYTGQLVQAGGDFKANVEQLESCIMHAAELADKGEFDFRPDFHVDIQREN